MQPAISRSANKAFTLIELLVVIALLGIILAMYLPTVNRGDKLPAQQGACMNNLRQIAIGLWLYSDDHSNQFPWQVSMGLSENKEISQPPMAARYFLTLSNHVKLPRSFVCPTDKARHAAADFSDFSNTNLSYFASLNTGISITSSPSLLILAGDRHLSLDNQPVKPSLCNVDSHSTPGWTRELHEAENSLRRGSLLFVDGHTVFVRSEILPVNFRSQPIKGSRLVIP